MRSLCNQEYPSELFEIIIVDDGSTDKTWDLISGFYHPEKEICSLRLEDISEGKFSAYKKRAIFSGIGVSHNDVIVTTDADCLHPPEWLKTLDAFYRATNAALTVAPVTYSFRPSVLEMFQALDFLILQGITGASVFKNIHSMCNGANLAYEKNAFEDVQGFEGIDHVASGDDMLLMYKISKKFPKRIKYLKSKNATVTTPAMTTWKDFFNQRIRWSSKARFYDDKRIFWTLLLVYLFNLSFLALLIAAIWHVKFLFWVLILWIAKTLVEFPFVNAVATYFNKRSLLNFFFFFQPLHVAYTIIAGWLGQFKKYEWKGRKIV